MARLKSGSRGLDDGRGPGPAIAVMLREAGHEMLTHDPFFACDEGALNRTYCEIPRKDVAIMRKPS